MILINILFVKNFALQMPFSGYCFPSNMRNPSIRNWPEAPGVVGEQGLNLTLLSSINCTFRHLCNTVLLKNNLFF